MAKVARGHCKAAVTRMLGTLQRHMAEDNPALVKGKLGDVQAAFERLETAHDEYNDLLASEDALIESEEWFGEAQETYSCKIREALQWIKARENPSGNVAVDNPSIVSDSSTSYDLSDLINVMSMPKVEIDKFSGEPLEFQNFMTTFDEVVGNRTDDDQLKLTRLLFYTTGPAKSAIRNCSLVGGTEGYKQARDILQSRFGNVHLLSQRIINDMKNGKSISKSCELQQLADELAMASVSLSKLGMTSEIENQHSLIQILERCPPFLRNQWKKKVLECKRNDGDYPKFDEFVEFIRVKASDSCDPVYGSTSLTSRKPGKSATVQNNVSEIPKKPANAMAPPGATRAFTAEPTVQQNKCVVCSQMHNVLQCNAFKSLSPRARFQTAKEKRLCYVCLTPGHFTRDCPKDTVCTVPECGKRHSKFIHVDYVNRTNVTGDDNDSPGQPVNNGNVSACASNVYLPMVEVNVNGKRVLALLDQGSTNTFMTQSLATSLGLSGPVENCVVRTLSNKSMSSLMSVKCKVTSTDGVFSEELSNVLVTTSLPSRYPDIDIDVSKYPHLMDMPLPMIHKGTKCDLLIGQDNGHLLIPLEVRYDMNDMKLPYATRSVYGWALNGPVGEPGVRNATCFHVTLEQRVENLWALENRDSEDLCHSIEDRKVLDLWESEISLRDGHYTLPIPWKDGQPALPNNKGLAIGRLQSQVKRLNKVGLMKTYDDNVTSMVSNGYAERVPESELDLADGSVWYLPHRHVVSDSKPGKIRIVFDCAAKYQDICLNSQCFQGPDITNKLIRVLLRFRQFKYAVMADIEKMYLQVRAPLHDRNALRFLWFEHEKLTEYRMTCHLFGGIWCSSISTFALRQTAKNLPDHDLIKETVLNAFYVDDLLKSVAPKDDAKRVVFDTKRVIKSAGFNLTKFVTNNNELLDQIDVNERASEVKEIMPDMYSRALGIKWQVCEDAFCYRSKQADDSGAITRRLILSRVSAMYDPLGLISPIVLRGKMIFQEATKLGLDWDDPVPDYLAHKWLSWRSSLDDLEKLSFQRCMIPEGFENGVAELHIFSDASVVGYGACCYLRVVSPDGQIRVTLVASKGRLAPIRAVTIPRLELTAAVTAVQLDELIRSCLEIQFLPTTFWIDSQIVLAYLRNDKKRFRVFVANRVSRIRCSTVPEQWRFISGRENAADVISRGCDVSDMPPIWSEGPSFLHQFKCYWQSECHDVVAPLTNDPEVILTPRDSTNDVSCSALATATVVHPIDQLLAHYSSYYKVKKAVGWLRRFLDFLQSKSVNTNPLTVSELSQAEHVILRHVQGVCFSTEMADIRRQGHVKKSSHLVKLCPKLENDLLVIGGRLKHAFMSDQSKNPIILPKGHRVSQLICEEYHGSSHVGTEWVLSQIRNKFWVVNARAMLKSIRRNCMVCKRMYSTTCTQKMADLPPERCQPYQPPFSNVGVDIFGPFNVTQKWSQVKRYGCVFSCFVTRAIHLEVLSSMETDSFINAFIRFVARRGAPLKVRSDNGTNLVGARSELARNLREIDRTKIVCHARKQGVDWTFNPPHASHHGGVWERMIRTIRQILMVLLSPNTRLSDEVLQTIFCEVENVVNSRPLTKCSNDIDDESPLTPNHFVLLRGNFAYPWSLTQESDTYRKRWKLVQHIVSQFWRKWIKMYLPELQCRQKWLKSRQNVQVGDLVLIQDETCPRGCWPLGLVEGISVGRDGMVRSAKIRTKTSTLIRPITKLVMLEGVHYDT